MPGPVGVGAGEGTAPWLDPDRQHGGTASVGERRDVRGAMIVASSGMPG